MKKYCFFMVILLSIITTNNAQELESATYRGKYGEDQIFLTFTDNNRISLSTMTTSVFGETGENITINDVKLGTYSLSNNHGILFMTVHWDNKTSVQDTSVLDTRDEYLVLMDGRACNLYQSDGKPVFQGAYWGENEDLYNRWWRFGHLDPAQIITASSSLREGNIIHSPTNLNHNIGAAWSEGVAGQGIGEYVTIKHYRGIDDFYISIGYVSFSKPHLYYENSRPRRLRLTYDDEHFIFVDLEDTPHYQNLGGSDIYDIYHYGKERYDDHYGSYKTLKIEIADVFPGSKYTDTCINAVLIRHLLP